MPSIIKDEKQEQALRDIQKDLMIVADINKVLYEPVGGGTLDYETAEKKHISIAITEAMSKPILGALDKRRTELVGEIKKLCKSYRIALNEAEETIIGDIAGGAVPGNTD